MNYHVELRERTQAGPLIPLRDEPALHEDFFPAWKEAVRAAQEHAYTQAVSVCVRVLDPAGKLMALRYFHPSR